MSRQRSIVSLAIVLPCFWVAKASAQTGGEAPTPPVVETTEQAAAVDPSGTWKWQYQFGDNTMDAKLKLHWDGKRLTGKYTARNVTSEIRDAKIAKDQVSFSTVRNFNGNEFEIDFKGQLKPDDIVGTVSMDFGQAQDFEWKAKRAVEADDVLGVWDLRLETPNGVVEPKLTITRGENDKLQGRYVSVFGDREPKNLTIKDNQLMWEISAGENDDFDFKVVYTGKPRGNKIAGKTEFDFNGNTGTMEFTGKRTPPEEKKDGVRPADAKRADKPVADTKAAEEGSESQSPSADVRSGN
jgi:hypothetical protein